MKRSTEKEILDLGSQYYTLEEYQHCQQMLFRINKMLGIFSDTARLLKKCSQDVTVWDIGCGGGLFLLNLHRFFPHMRFIGTDISSDAITTANQALERAQSKNEALNASFHLQNALSEKSADVVLLNLVCHHLSDAELVDFFPKLQLYARQLVVIHDLHRHIIPFIFYKLFSYLLFRNRLITHDGLISIRRGFKRHELKALLKKAGIKNFQIKWHFPFRWRVLIWKN